VGDCVDTDAQAGVVLSTVKRFTRVDCSESTARFRIVSIIPAGLSAVQSCPDTAELSVEIVVTTYCLSSDLNGLETPKLPFVKPGDCLDVDEIGSIVNSFHAIDCSDAAADARVISVIPFFGPIANGECPTGADTWIDVTAQTISGSGRRICIANI
jgi:hypothetical protein